jgi:hypothetical protein
VFTRRGSIDYDSKNKLSVPRKTHQEKGNFQSPDRKIITQRKFTSEFPQKRVFASDIKKGDDGLLTEPIKEETTPEVKVEEADNEQKASNDIDELIEQVKQTSFILEFEE